MGVLACESRYTFFLFFICIYEKKCYFTQLSKKNTFFQKNHFLFCQFKFLYYLCSVKQIKQTSIMTTQERLEKFFNNEHLPLIAQHYSDDNTNDLILISPITNFFYINFSKRLSSLFEQSNVWIDRVELSLPKQSIRIDYSFGYNHLSKNNFTDDEYNIVLDLLDEWYSLCSQYVVAGYEENSRLPELTDTLKEEILNRVNEGIANRNGYKCKAEWEIGRLAYESNIKPYPTLVVYYWKNEQWYYSQSVVFKHTKFGNGIKTMSIRTSLCGEFTMDFDIDELVKELQHYKY